MNNHRPPRLPFSEKKKTIKKKVENLLVQKLHPLPSWHHLRHPCHPWPACHQDHAKRNQSISVNSNYLIQNNVRRENIYAPLSWWQKHLCIDCISSKRTLLSKHNYVTLYFEGKHKYFDNCKKYNNFANHAEKAAHWIFSPFFSKI